MSKKSTSRYENEGDADSTSHKERCSSTKSNASFEKEDSPAGPSGDYDCSNSSSLVSLNYSTQSSWAKLTNFENTAKQDLGNFEQNKMYIDNLKFLRRQLNLIDLSDTELSESQAQLPHPHSQMPVSGCADINCLSRRYSSAPAYTNRKFFSNMSTLHIIDESDERSVSSNENSKCLASHNTVLNLSVNISNSVQSRVENCESGDMQCSNAATPRCYEVPPKRICRRERTPDLKTNESKDINDIHRVNEDLLFKFGFNTNGLDKRPYAIRAKSKADKTSVSTQMSCIHTNIRDNLEAVDSGKPSIEKDNLYLNFDNISVDYSLSPNTLSKNDTERKSSTSSYNSVTFFSNQGLTRTSKRASINKQLSAENKPTNSSNDLELSTNLPSSVVEPCNKPPTLEPNIIVLDNTDRIRKRKKKKKDPRVGDVSSDSSNYLLKKFTFKQLFTKTNSERSSSDTRRSLLKKYYECMTEVTSKSSPTYVVSTNVTDTIDKCSSNTSSQYSLAASPTYTNSTQANFPDRMYSPTELQEREIRTIEPNLSDEEFTECLSHLGDNSNEKIDIQSFKSVIENFAEGVKPTKKFPDNFDDVEERERLELIKIHKLNGDVPSFKEKASELLMFANSKTSYRHQSNKKESEAGINLKPNASVYFEAVEKPSDKSLVDARKHQNTDFNYYIIPTSSSSDDESDRVPDLSVSEMQLENSDQNNCCSCFGSFKN